MTGHGQKFDKKKELAVAALLVQPTISKAAKHAGISESTLLRWMKRPEFQAAFTAARRKVLFLAIARVQQTTGDAVETLHSVMTDQNTPGSTRVAAAKIVFDIALKATELEDFDQRLGALEQWLGHIQNFLDDPVKLTGNEETIDFNCNRKANRSFGGNGRETLS